MTAINDLNAGTSEPVDPAPVDPAPRDASALRTPLATGETGTTGLATGTVTMPDVTIIPADVETEIEAIETEVKNLRAAAPVVDDFAKGVIHDIRGLFTKLVGHLGI
jgi:hypothetical protein